MLRELGSAYMSNFEPENGALTLENTDSRDDNVKPTTA
jgi:hypothetical protein